jgi:hypothetical protein
MVATVGVVGGLIGLAVPAQAGTKWSPPQQVSTKYGREIQLSDNGKVAVWIRTNRLMEGVVGPVRSSYYISKKKGWTSSAAMPGSTETTRLMLSSDGGYAFLENGTSGYALAKRTNTNNWATAQPVVTGILLTAGQMSANATTITWVDWADPGSWVFPAVEPPGDLKAIVRGADGTWSAPVLVGKVATEARYSDYGPAGPKLSAASALSRDGKTLVWLDETHALRSAALAADGTWTPTGIIKQYTDYAGLSQLSVSANGTSVMWIRSGTDGILTSTRGSTGWTVPVMATVDDTNAAAMSPDGKYMAWSTGSGDIEMSSRLPDRWATAKTVGTVFYGYNAFVVMTNKTVAYGSIGWKNGKYTCAVSASVLSGGSWKKGKKLASSVCHPAVAYNGKTIVWGNLVSKKLESVKR